MDIAERTAQLSRAVRLKVGAIVVKDDRIISLGFNGTPAGWDNKCEIDIYDDAEQWVGNRTKPEVLHAELNSLMKLAKSIESGEQASMFITHSPCMDCAKGIYQAGIREVFYREDYRSNDGIKFLKKCKVEVTKVIQEK